MFRFLGERLRKEASGPMHQRANVDVVHTLTLPNGKKIRVLRRDVFERACARLRESKST